MPWFDLHDVKRLVMDFLIRLFLGGFLYDFYFVYLKREIFITGLADSF